MDTHRQYEVVFIVDPTAVRDRFVTGVITQSESMGRRQLAYEILHKTEGSFVLLEIEGSGHEIAELERRMRVNDRIIRYITVRVDEDRRRAEKFKAKRARKAAKKPGAQGAQQGSAAEPARPQAPEAEEDAA